MPAQARSAETQQNHPPVSQAENSASSVVRTQRALETLRLLQSGQTWTAGELADRFGCSSRTVFRDMQLLRDCGIQVESPTGERGFRLAHDFYWKPVRPTLDEMIALVLGARLAGATMPVELARRMTAAIDKVVSAAQPTIRERLLELTQRIDSPHQGCLPPLPNAESLPVILQHIVTRLPVRILIPVENSERLISLVVTLERLTVVDFAWHLAWTQFETGKIFSAPLGNIKKVESPKNSHRRAVRGTLPAQEAETPLRSQDTSEA